MVRAADEGMDAPQRSQSDASAEVRAEDIRARIGPSGARRRAHVGPVAVRMRASGAAMVVSTTHAAFLVHHDGAEVLGDLNIRQRASYLAALRQIRDALAAYPYLNAQLGDHGHPS